MIREYTNHFSVIVPYRAFSAATLTALGANEIIMHPMGMLGPTDPSVTNHFNPTNQAGQPLPISVEDVTAYIQLIKEDAGIQHEDELVQLVKILADKIHPLALGNVKRSISQSRMMAFKLLKLHMPKNNEHKIQEIADNLTSKLFYHGHPINRKEAKEQVGLTTVVDAKPDLEKVIWELYLEYEKSLKLVTPFNAMGEFTKQFPELEDNKIQIFKPGKEKLVYIEIESAYDYDVVSVDIQLVGTKQQNGLVSVIPVFQPLEWSKNDT